MTAAEDRWCKARREASSAARRAAVGALLAWLAIGTARADDAAFTAWHRASGLPGLCVASADANGVRHAAGFGWADIEARVAYTPDTVQPVGSVSKTVIGLALADLAARGRLQLDDAVDAALPFAVRHPRSAGRGPSWRQLATHTGGIADDEAAYERAYQPGHARTQAMPAFVAAYFADGGGEGRFTPHAPGAGYRYSNVGAALAAVALEGVVGQPFDTFSIERYFAPLGMTGSGWQFDPVLGSRNARLYEAAADGRERPLPPYHLVTYADGGLHTSCRDLARYAAALLRAHAGSAVGPITPDIARSMLAPQLDARSPPPGQPPGEINQGLFWQHRRSGGVGHSGSDPGVTAFFSLDLGAGRARVFIANASIEERPAAQQAFREMWRALGAL